MSGHFEDHERIIDVDKVGFDGSVAISETVKVVVAVSAVQAPSGGNFKLSLEKRHEAIDFVVRGGLTIEEAGARVGVTKQAVSRWCRLAGVDPRMRHKIVQEKRRKKVVALFRDTVMSKSDICRELQLSSKTAWKWLKGIKKTSKEKILERQELCNA